MVLKYKQQSFRNGQNRSQCRDFAPFLHMTQMPYLFYKVFGRTKRSLPTDLVPLLANVSLKLHGIIVFVCLFS